MMVPMRYECRFSFEKVNSDCQHASDNDRSRGTGLAPFRGFTEERDLIRKDNQTIGDTIMYSDVGRRLKTLFMVR